MRIVLLAVALLACAPDEPGPYAEEWEAARIEAESEAEESEVASEP